MQTFRTVRKASHSSKHLERTLLCVFDSHICTERLRKETDLNSKIRVLTWERWGLSRWSHFRIQTVAGYGYSKNEMETEDAEHILQLVTSTAQ